MANERIPNDPYGSSQSEYDRQLDDELRFDPEAREPISGTKVAMFAVAIALVLGALFYGLNNTSVQQAQTSPPAQTAQGQPSSQTPTQAPPGMRDVTPHANTEPGVTTGQASSPPRPAGPAGKTQPEIR